MEQAELTISKDKEPYPVNHAEAEKRIEDFEDDPQLALVDRLHNVSACRLPQAREIMQRRYD